MPTDQDAKIVTDPRATEHDGTLATAMSHRNLFVHRSPLHEISIRALAAARKRWSPRLGRGIPRHAIIDRLQHLDDRWRQKNVVSIDFFDTLALRPIEPPEFVIEKIAELSVSAILRECGLRLAEEEYLRGRSHCEARLRRNNVMYLDGDGEISLEQILSEYLAQLGVLNSELLNRLIDLEIRLESDLLQLNSGALDLLVMLKEAGKSTIIASDMYLSAKQLGVFCTKLGINPYVDRIYVSGECGVGKHSGRLFQHILASEQITPSDFIHIGDNANSDYLQPTLLGIEAVWLHERQNLRRRYRIEKKLRSQPQKFLEQFHERRGKKQFGSCENLEFYLFRDLAPAVFASIYCGIRDCLSLGIRRFYFLAREGIILQKVFDSLLRQHPEFSGEDVQTSILYCSRASTICARFDPAKPALTAAEVTVERFYNISYQNLLAAWNLSPDDFGHVFVNPPQLRSVKDIQKLFKENVQFAKTFSNRILAHQKLLVTYLNQERLFEQPCALIDVGWGATIQQNLEALRPSWKPVGIYLGTDHRYGVRNIRGYLFSPADFRAGAVLKSAPLMETLLSVEDVGSTYGYEQVGDVINPLQKRAASRPSDAQVSRDSVFGKYCETFVDLTRKYCMPADTLIEYGRERIHSMVCHPQREFLEAVARLNFSFDWGDEETHNLITPLPVSLFRKPKALAKRLWEAPWLFGTLKSHHLGLFNTPLSWLLGHEERLNKDSLAKLKRFVKS